MGRLIIRAEGLTKAYRRPDGSRIQALAGIDLAVSPGEVVAVVGPEGSGKTTLLRLLAGLDRPDSGRLVRKARDSSRPVTAMAFQHDSLFPWLTVAGNIAYGLRLRRWPPEHRRDAVAHFGRCLGLTRFLNAYPNELSTAGRALVAIARALAHDPDILLLDEPFRCQDAEGLERLTREIRAMHRARRPALVYTLRGPEDLTHLGGRTFNLMP